MRSATMPRLVPYITLREGEENAPDNLVIDLDIPKWPRLRYLDETPLDRDPRGVLWGRCSQTIRSATNMPTGQPRWKFVHPSRQRETMLELRCQVCVQPAKTPLGWIFMAGPQELGSESDLVITVQPPVCAKHVRPAALLCPHLDGQPLIFLAQAAPLYGVHGTLYGFSAEHGVHVVDTPEHPLPYGHPNLPTFLASQLVRRLKAFQLITLDELTQALEAAA
ncbi:hypothetical protein AB0A69_07920 [Streptomyces sp. NPDC045431]|uniref:hypothetical protein n=1 Tax=Streptomyces sp. NPDC045431 TaxID=3155613 RepID=UPI0033EE0A35